MFSIDQFTNVIKQNKLKSIVKHFILHLKTGF